MCINVRIMITNVEYFEIRKITDTNIFYKEAVRLLNFLKLMLVIGALTNSDCQCMNYISLLYSI